MSELLKRKPDQGEPGPSKRKQGEKLDQSGGPWNGGFWSSFTPANVIQILLIVVAGLVFGVRLEGRVARNEKLIERIEQTIALNGNRAYQTAIDLGRVMERTESLRQEIADVRRERGNRGN